MVTTSGTVAQYNFTNRKIIDLAVRRCGGLPEKLGSEGIEICFDTLFLLQTEWVNAGFPLWTREFVVLGPTIGSPDVPMPPGTVDIITSFWRILQPYRGAATISGNSSTNNLFSGQPGTDVVIPGANPFVEVSFGTATEVDTIGVLTGNMSPYTTALSLYTSPDGSTWTLAQTLPSATYTQGQWTYFDLDPSLSAAFLRLQYTTGGSWTLNQVQFALANGQDITIGPLSIDNYYNLPDKMFQGSQPNSGYDDRQLNGPVLKAWPVPNQDAFYNGAFTALIRRYIQDPGTMTNIIEAPIRWYEAAICRLAAKLIDTLPENQGGPASPSTPALYNVKQLMADRLEKKAEKAEMLAWAEERVRAPIQLYPSIRGYTR